MIYFVTGKIGGGKTLLMLTKILAHLGRGGCVVTNIALDEREIDLHLKRNHGRRLVDGQIRRHDFEAEPEFQGKVPFGVMGCPVWVVCDEAQLYYNQADSSTMSAKLKRLVSYLTQSRKCAVDVWFITQHDTTVWTQFRHQALFGYKCRDMRVVNLPFFGTISALGMCWAKYDIISGEIMERGRTPLSKALFKCYDTRQMYDSQMTELQKTAEIWNPPPKRAKGKYETGPDSGSSPRRFRWWRIQSPPVVGEQQARSGDTEVTGDVV